MNTPAFFSIGFRPFFASGILFAAFAFLLWGGVWQFGFNTSLVVDFSPYSGWLFWHPHELIMGFAVAIIIGFLLTAVRNWTGFETASPFGIFCIWLSWILARWFMLFSEGVSFEKMVIAQVAPILLAAAFIGKPIFIKRLWRNLFAPAILILFAIFEVLLLIQIDSNQDFPSNWFLAALLLIAFTITMIGGRIIPFFTANKLKLPKTEEPRVVFLSVVIPLLVLIILLLMDDFEFRSALINVCAAILFIAHCLRLKIWFRKGMLFEPMLWSLWLFYASLPIGFLLMAIPSQLISLGSIPLHVLAIGGMCGLIVSMVSRVSMGHTGRVITHDRYIVSAFGFIFLGLVLRAFIPIIIGLQTYLITFSALFLATAMAIIFIRFIYAWVTPRPDGKA